MDDEELLNKYDVPQWLVEALKAYDGLMSSGKGKIKGNKMKAKRQLAEAISKNQYIYKTVEGIYVDALVGHTDTLRSELRDLFEEQIDYVKVHDPLIDQAMQLIKQDREAAKLQAIPDLAWCLGKLRGLGHPNEAMEKRWKLVNSEAGS